MQIHAYIVWITFSIIGLVMIFIIIRSLGCDMASRKKIQNSRRPVYSASAGIPCISVSLSFVSGHVYIFLICSMRSYVSLQSFIILRSLKQKKHSSSSASEKNGLPILAKSEDF
jgi:hypothetical protein